MYKVNQLDFEKCNDTYVKLAYCHSYYNHLNMLDYNVMHAQELFNNNKINVLCAGFEMIAMIDTGASISVIDETFFKTIGRNYSVNTCNYISCRLADGSNVQLSKQVKLPMKFDGITIEAELFILSMSHVKIIIGCDLLNILNARIDFKANTLMLQKPNPTTRIACLQQNTLGHIDILPQTFTYYYIV